MADGRYFEIVTAPHFNKKSVRFWWNMVRRSKFRQKWQSFHLNSTISKQCFGQTSAPNYLILVKFCVMMKNHILLRLR